MYGYVWLCMTIYGCVVLCILDNVKPLYDW